jgi:hypothetical protein
MQQKTNKICGFTFQKLGLLSAPVIQFNGLTRGKKPKKARLSNEEQVQFARHKKSGEFFWKHFIFALSLAPSLLATFALWFIGPNRWRIAPSRVHSLRLTKSFYSASWFCLRACSLKRD